MYIKCIYTYTCIVCTRIYIYIHIHMYIDIYLYACLYTCCYLPVIALQCLQWPHQNGCSARGLVDRAMREVLVWADFNVDVVCVQASSHAVAEGPSTHIVRILIVWAKYSFFVGSDLGELQLNSGWRGFSASRLGI